MKRILPFCLVLVLCLASSCGDQDVVGPETANVRIQLSPDSTVLHHNESIQFRARVTGAADTTVTWTLEGKANGDSLVGTLTRAGLYTAPARIPQTLIPFRVMVTATSLAVPSHADSAEVTLVSGEEGPCIELSPFECTVGLGERVVFDANIENASDLTLVWSVDEIPGISDAGTMESPGVYRAPEILVDTLTVTLRATSTEDPSKSAVALMHVIPKPLVTIGIQPQSATLETNRSLLLEARVLDSPDTSIIWSVNGKAGGDSLRGVVSPVGLYTAPASVPPSSPVTVRATSRAQPTRYADALVEIEPAAAGPSILLSPAEVRVAFDDSQAFRAETGKTMDMPVTWSVDEIPGVVGVGLFDMEGLYRAPSPAMEESLTVVVRATSTENVDVSAAALVHLYHPPVVHVAPPDVSVNAGLGQQFSATVTRADDPTVTWRVNGIEGGNAVFGTITSTGYYVAPAAVPSPEQVEVEAVLAEDSRRADTAWVMVLPPIEVHLSPADAAVVLDQELFFEFRVENTPDTGLDWYVNDDPGGSGSFGYIHESGKYEAPSTLPDPPHVEVKAVSRKDPARFATATVEIVLPAVFVFEAETYTQAGDEGGDPVFIIDQSAHNASGDYAVEGLDRVFEWIEVPIHIEYSGMYKIVFRHAAHSSITAQISMPGCGSEGQDGSWTLSLSGNSCT